MRGVVEAWLHERDFGFIQGEDEKQYFVHASYILDDGYRYLDKGERVEFEPARSAAGKLQAHHVRPLQAKEAFQEAAHRRFEAKPNPFTPQEPVSDPMLFAGREDYVAVGVDEILNHQNLLITGSRGVGKSSYALQLTNIASGDFSLLEKLDIPDPSDELNYLVVSTVCYAQDDLSTVVDSVTRDLIAATNQEAPDRKSRTTLGINPPLLKAEHTVESEVSSPQGLASAFVRTLIDASQCLDAGVNGICVLLDEVDVLPSTVDIASFVKAVFEGLRANHVTQVSFVISGVSGRVTDLIQQHGSAGRLFTNIHLDPMTRTEIKSVVLEALNGTGISILPRALDRIADLGGCFPSNTQLLGFYSYQVNTNESIDLDDVARATTRILDFPRKQLYRDRQRELIGATGGWNLPDLFVHSSEATVKLAAEALSVTHEEARCVLEELVDKDILTRSGDRYSLRDPLFREFLRRPQ